MSLEGFDAERLEVRLLAPLDLAVSKLSRFSEQDRNDILSLARHRSLRTAKVRARALDALSGYVGSIERIQGSIELACRIIADQERRDGGE